MDDAALHQIAGSLDCDFADLRMARSLRNAIAHAEPTNPQRVEEYLQILEESMNVKSDREERRPPASEPPRSAYRIHAWLDEELERDMLANGFVSVGGDEMGDLTGVSDPDEIRRRLERSMPDRTPRAIRIFVGYWKRFLCEASSGDVVVLPTRDGTVAIGEFTGPYRYVAEADPHARHRRAVDWHTDSVDRDDLREDLRKVLSGRHTVQDFKAPDAARRLLAIADSGTDPG